MRHGHAVVLSGLCAAGDGAATQLQAGAAQGEQARGRGRLAPVPQLRSQHPATPVALQGGQFSPAVCAELVCPLSEPPVAAWAGFGS